jgi:orotate phosphoribosyltransferase
VASRYPQLVKVLEEKSLQRGHFVLASGRVSDYYIDGKLTSFDPRGSALIVDAILSEIADLPVDAVGGMDMGATPIVAALANRSHYTDRPLPTFIVRKNVKQHGTMKLIEGPLPPKAKVVIIDDVVTTGKSILQAIDAVESEGAKVLLAISVLDRNAGAAEALRGRGIPYRPLVTLNDLGISDGTSRQGSQVSAG